MALTDTSSARIALFRTTGAPPSAIAPGNTDWLTLPFTGESLSEKLTSAQSAAMRDDRQFASSRLVRGESTGDISLEMAYGKWFDEVLSGVLQATPYPDNPLAAQVDTIANGKTKTFFAFEKRLEAETGFTYTVFQDCQLNTLSFDIQSNALVTMSLGVIGLTATTGTTEVANSTYTNFNIDDQMDSSFGASISFKDQANVPIDVTAQNFTLSIDNQMRGQQAVGYFYNAGVASGRFKATLSATIYFRNMDLYNKFKSNTGIKVEIVLSDSAGNSYRFNMDNVKTTSHDVVAGGADQDQTVTVELQAFPSGGAGTTLAITRTAA